mgnify:CR=1 FL=1
MHKRDFLKKKAVSTGKLNDWSTFRRTGNVLNQYKDKQVRHSVLNNAIKTVKKNYFTIGLEQSLTDPKKI